MSSGSYSLLNEPWIPVRWPSGPVGTPTRDRPERLGLVELLGRSDEIAGLAVVDPPAHAALLRVLYALTVRVTGLDRVGRTEDAWTERRGEVWDAGRLPADGIEEYAARYAHRFFVFDTVGARPWMQDPRLEKQCDPAKTAGVNKLIVTRPAGNNHAWFRHGSDATPDLPTVSEAVLNLLVWHYWGPSGRCSAREVDGEKTASATAGPLRTALSYHPVGKTLFETLLAGLAPPEPADRLDEDYCPWELDELPDPGLPPNEPVGPCSRLTGRSQHALLLVPDGDSLDASGAPTLVRDAYITWGHRAGRMARDDDFLIWQISQQGNRYPRPADSRRALWRDLDALLLKDPLGSAQARRPKVFRWAAELSEDLGVRALGFEQDGQAKDTQFVDGSTPPVLGFVEEKAPRTTNPIARLRVLGETYGFRLDRALTRAWRGYMGDPKSDASAWTTPAAARYWPAAEDQFWAVFRELRREPNKPDVGFDHEAARRAFLRLAEDAYDEVTRGVTGSQRGAKAVFEARVGLRRPPKSRQTQG
ncbi:type I-E CRISPR-associated protein Cse1/CasA [Streptomyces sp. DSM 44915]|uniref:Type I-E CRISPR-associated protein Cse1/CasA n=1 Tax=Streptomyces chisholmiae TaxID=3075540 RepID=A0ABU2JSD5_9ACTN|nr:type I-E CRISPR-associated protein Cse1/CasA [Streptomyces sp. DSM 44915]MDT0267651.1 type I-E CRISPR-associated protein Cse1/CasA [Streptomyces sp. DSM 44915]